MNYPHQAGSFQSIELSICSWLKRDRMPRSIILFKLSAHVKWTSHFIPLRLKYAISYWFFLFIVGFLSEDEWIYTLSISLLSHETADTAWICGRSLVAQLLCTPSFLTVTQVGGDDSLGIIEVLVSGTEGIWLFLLVWPSPISDSHSVLNDISVQLLCVADGMSQFFVSDKSHEL